MAGEFTEVAGQLLLPVALTPGLVAWWSDRKLLQLGDHPLLADRVLARNQLVTWILLATLATLLFAAEGASLFLATATAFIGVCWTSFRLRHRLLGETWGFWAYLTHTARILLAWRGWMILLVFTPWLVWSAAEWRWPTAAGLALALTLWSLNGHHLFVWMAGTKTLTRADLMPHLMPVLARSKVAQVRLYEMVRRGGCWPNAFALPAWSKPAVVFTDSLLDTCSADETAAIYAHEIAHLEELGRRWWLRRQGAEVTIGVTAALAPAMVASGWPQALGAPFALLALQLPVVLAAIWLAKSSHGKDHEAEADLRAVELGGNGEALISGLEKIHRALLLPRRWSHAFERQASHPSLIHRIRSIRAAMGSPPAPLIEPIALRSAPAETRMIFDSERLRWTDESLPDGSNVAAEGEPEGAKGPLQRALSYPQLSRINATVAANGETRLHAVSVTGEAWTMTVTEEDLDKIQPVLDYAEPLLTPVTRHPARGSNALGGLLAGLLLAYTIMAGHFGLLFAAAALALAARGRASFLALGAATIGASAVAWFHDRATAMGGALPEQMLLALALLGLAALWLAYLHGKAPGQPSKYLGWVVAVFGGYCVILWLHLGWILTQGLPAPELQALLVDNPQLIVAPLALAAGLLASTRRLVRACAVALALVAALTAAAGPLYAAHKSQIDGNLRVAETPALTLTRKTPTLARRIPLDFGARELRVSSSGSAYGLASYRDGKHSVLIGAADGSSTTLAARQLGFIDDSTVVLLSSPAEKLKVSSYSLTGATAESQISVELPPLLAPQLGVDAATATWWVLGWSRDGNDLLRLTGKLGFSEVSEQRWPMRNAPGPPILDMTVTGYSNTFALPGSVLARTIVRVAGDYPGWQNPTLNRLSSHFLDWTVHHITEFWINRSNSWQQHATTSLSLRCLGPEKNTAAVATCIAQDFETSWIWNFDATSGRWQIEAGLPESVYAPDWTDDGHLLLLASPSIAYVLDLQAGQIDRLNVRQDQSRPIGARIAGRHLWVLAYRDDGSSELLQYHYER